MSATQRIIVFQQSSSGEAKIVSIGRRGRGMMLSEVVDIDEPLPPIIDDSFELLPETLEGDLVLSFLKHPDLALDLARLCNRLSVPLVASGKKLPPLDGVITPPT